MSGSELLVVCRHILCVGGVMCMGRGVAHMVSKITFPPHQIAGEGRASIVACRVAECQIIYTEKTLE